METKLAILGCGKCELEFRQGQSNLSAQIRLTSPGLARDVYFKCCCRHSGTCQVRFSSLTSHQTRTRTCLLYKLLQHRVANSVDTKRNSPLQVSSHSRDTQTLNVARTTCKVMEGNTNSIMSLGGHFDLITFMLSLHPHHRFASTPRLLHNSIARIYSDLHPKRTSSLPHHGQEQKQEQEQIYTGERHRQYSKLGNSCQAGRVLHSIEPDHILKFRQRGIFTHPPNIRWYIGATHTISWSTGSSAQVTDRG